MQAADPLSGITVVSDAPQALPILAGFQRQTPDFMARGLRPAGTQDWLLVMTLSGRGFVRAQGQIRALLSDELLLFAPQAPQDYGAADRDGAWNNVWVHFRPRPHWIPWLVWPQQARGVMMMSAGDGADAIAADLRHMVEVSTTPLRLRDDLAMNALERALIGCDGVNPLQDRHVSDPRIRRALELIGENLARPLNIDGLARAVGLSRSRFTVLFTQGLNMSPQSYVEFLRLERAARMLALSTWSVAHIAEQVGFPNPYYFSTRFRARHGLPPSAYRARMAGAAA